MAGANLNTFENFMTNTNTTTASKYLHNLPGTIVPIPIMHTVNKGTFTFKNQQNLLIKFLKGLKSVSIKILPFRPNFTYIVKIIAQK